MPAAIVPLMMIGDAIFTVAGPAAIMMGLNAITSLILKKQKPVDPGRIVTFREAAAARRVIYGLCRVGAVPTFIHSSSVYDYPNQYLIIVYTLCAHEINLLASTLFDGVAISWGSYNSNPGMPLFWEENGKYRKQVWGDWKLGKPGEPAFPGLIGITTRDNSNLWTADHRQDGCASVVLVLSFNSDMFPNGQPSVTFSVQGKKLYDPRTGNTVYSKNAALAIYDFLTNKEYGMGADPSEVNTASVVAAANVCDEDIPLKAGGTENRYEVNGMFSMDAQPGDILRALADAMAGYVIYTQGQWYLVPGVWNSPSVHLTDDDLRAPLQVRTLSPKRELCNAVRGTFYAAQRAYQKADFPPVVHPEHICDDSGYPNAVQKGQWDVATAYALGDCVIDQASRVLTGIWAAGHLYHVNEYAQDTYAGVTSIYVCTQQHTSSAAGTGGNEPGRGATWQNYWVDVTATYSEFRGGVYVCTTAHTSAALDEPGIGANWPTYWIEAKEYIWRELELAFTTSAAMAQRIAKITLERARHQITAVLKCKLSAMQLQPGDTFYYTHDRYGWTNKVFQVLESNFVLDEQSLQIGVDLKVQEVDASIYAWDQNAEEQALGEPSQPTMPDTEIPRPTPAAYGPGVTWMAYDTHVTFDWDYTGDNAIVLLDQENTEYTPQGSQDVTGLTANTSYKFYPAYNRNISAFTALMSDGVGSPAWLEVPSTDAVVKRARLAEWQRTGNIPLAAGPLDVATHTTGQSGGGGGGGDGGCLQIGMFVKERNRGVIRCEDVRPGEVLWSDHPDGMLVHTVARRPHDLWAIIGFNNGARVIVTASHPFTLADGSMKRAAQLCLEDALPTPTGIAYPVSILFRKVESEKIPIKGMERHTFYASMDGENWVLTHNINLT